MERSNEGLSFDRDAFPKGDMVHVGKQRSVPDCVDHRGCFNRKNASRKDYGLGSDRCKPSTANAGFLTEN